jgi:hypothetical protein
MKHLNKFYALSIVAIYMLVVSCTGATNENESSGNQTGEGFDNQNSQTALGPPEQWLIVKMAGEESGRFFKDSPASRFFVNGIEYQSKLKGDKRKYAVKSGDIIAEIKFKDDAFKVRKPDGSLLWKVKLYDDKVKISNNEENLNPFEIKTGESGKAKVKKEEETIGEIRLRASDNKVEITSDAKSFYIDADKIYLAYGVLLINEIPENIRYMIAAELLEKGK